jgi:hypothetical protein
MFLGWGNTVLSGIYGVEVLGLDEIASSLHPPRVAIKMRRKHVQHALDVGWYL